MSTILSITNDNIKIDYYVCDPLKNTHCSRKNCAIYGGECKYTTEKDAARSIDSNEPLTPEQTSYLLGYTDILNNGIKTSAPLITRFDKELDAWVNELTKEMDSYLLHAYTWGFFVTYIYEPLKTASHQYVIRFPGATRGCIICDKNDIIQKIDFYEDTCYNIPYSDKNSRGKRIEWMGPYHSAMNHIRDKYIGRKMIIESIIS